MFLQNQSEPGINARFTWTILFSNWMEFTFFLWYKMGHLKRTSSHLWVRHEKLVCRRDLAWDQCFRLTWRETYALSMRVGRHNLTSHTKLIVVRVDLQNPLASAFPAKKITHNFTPLDHHDPIFKVVIYYYSPKRDLKRTIWRLGRCTGIVSCTKLWNISIRWDWRHWTRICLRLK